MIRKLFAWLGTAFCVLGLTACGGGGGTGIVIAPSQFTIGGTMSGLAGSGLVLQLNGGNNLAVAANGSFTFANSLVAGTAYTVTLQAQPSAPTQVCTVSNGGGSVGAANVSNVQVSCVTSQFTVGGSVSGMSGSGLVLRLNGANDLTILSSGNFQFTPTVASGATYAVTIATQPGNPAQTCSVANGSGTVGSANIANLQVTCSILSFTVGGTVSGLSGSGLVLQNNGGNNLPVNTNGPFTFTTAVANSGTFAVTVLTQPTNPAQLCVASSGSGTIGNANVSNVTISCASTTALVPRYLFAGGSEGKVDIFAISAATGAISPRGTLDPLGGAISFGPSGAMVTSRLGNILWLVATRLPVTNPAQFEIRPYFIDTTTGNLTPTGAAAPQVHATTRIVLDRSGTVMLAAFEENAAGLLSSYLVDASTGALTAGSNSLATNQAVLPGAIFHPNGRYAYVATGGALQWYSVDASTAVLTLGGTVPSGCTDPLATPDGAFLYCATSALVQVFSLNATTGAPSAVQSGGAPMTFAIPGRANSGKTLGMDAAGKYLYAASQPTNNVTAFQINAATGALTAAPGSPFALEAGGFASDLKVDPSGQYVYVSHNIRPNNSNRRLDGFRIDPATGTLSKIAATAFDTTIFVGQLAISASVTPNPLPKARFVFGLTSRLEGVVGYSVNPVTGALTAIGPTPIAAGTTPSGLAVDPAGRVLYVVNRGSNNISGYLINGITGVLTPLAGSPYPAGGTDPRDIAIDPSGRYLFVANRGSNSVTGHLIGAGTGVLTPLASAIVSNIPQPTAVKVDPTGRFVYAWATSQVNPLNSGPVHLLTLSPLNGALASSGNTYTFSSNNSQAGGLAMSDNGQYLYTTSDAITVNTVFGAAINGGSGALGGLPGNPYTAGAGLGQDLSVHPGGLFLYVAGGSLFGYAINVTNGVPAAMIIGGQPTGRLTPNTDDLRSVAVDPSGALVYAGSRLPNTSFGVRVFDIDPASGRVTEIAGSPFAAPAGANLGRILLVR